MFRIPPTWKESFTKYPNGFSLMEMLSDWATKANDLKNSLDGKTDKTGDHKGTWQGLKPSEAQEGIPGLIDQLTERIEDVESVSERMVNVQDFGAVGDGYTNDTGALQSAFDYAKNNNVHTVLIPEGTYIIDHNRVHYEVADSILVCKGWLKYFSNEEASGSHIRFGAPNIIVFGLKVNGNRQNNIVSSSRGTQFNFSVSQSGDGVRFIGGESINALQNSVQTESNVRFDGMKFSLCGEHHIYTTTAQDTAGPDYVDIRNCYFEKWDTENLISVACSLRDAQKITVDNCDFNPGHAIGSKRAMSINLGSRDTVSVTKEKVFMLTNSRVGRPGDYPANMVYVQSEGHVLVDNCVIFGRPRANLAAQSTIRNSQIYLQSENSTHDNAFKIFDNCQLYGGRLQPNHAVTLKNCGIYYDSTMSGDFINFRVNTIPDGAHVVEGCTFHDFNGEMAVSIIRLSSEQRDVVKDNRFINCGEGSYIRATDEGVVSGNINLSPGQDGKITGDSTAEHVYNNVLNDDR